MIHGRTRDIPLVEARRLIERAIDKAEQLELRGGIAVVGASGALVSTSRMDRGGAGGMARARSKAWISATQQIPSAEHLKRMNFVSAPVERGFVACSPEARFPGAGGMPVLDGAEVVGGIAASGATVSPFFPRGIEPEKMIADGQPANPEDLLVHYALGLPYVGQHGDDFARWTSQFGGWPANPGAGVGGAEAPRSSKQFEHEWAVGLADDVIAEARARRVRIAVAIVDHRGDPIQQDVMDDAPSAASFISAATAATAATFQCLSSDLATVYGAGAEAGAGNASAVTQLQESLPFAILAIAGGVPVEEDGRVVAGLGIAGAAPALCAEIALAALARRA